MIFVRCGQVARDALPVPGRLRGRGGGPEGYCHRQMLDAIRYVVAGGIQWRAMRAAGTWSPTVSAWSFTVGQDRHNSLVVHRQR
ncbi:transposase [Streptomyces niveus]|uniref:transposase n=1 Tax=Streptomyces niveus TaxID=193462 RepID=UPI003833A0EB